MILDTHTKIAVDYDDTLIGHWNYSALYQYILDHHREKEFYIVTSRSHGLQDEIIPRLSFFHDFSPSLFRGIHNIPDAIYAAYEKDMILRHKDLLTEQFPFTEAEKIWADWKANTCKKLGCTILVDDMTAVHGPGCRDRDIVIVHPDHLWDEQSDQSGEKTLRPAKLHHLIGGRRKGR